MSDAKAQIDKDKADPSMEEILATIRRIIAEDEQKMTGRQAAATGVAAERNEPRHDHDSRESDAVLVLTEAVNDDGSVRHIEPSAAAAAVPPLPEGRIEPEPPRPDIPSEPLASGEHSLRAGQRLSSSASSLAAAALARRAERERREADIPMGAAGKTLEDIVRETLEPLLQAWLEENLPKIVEPLVRAEIARVVAETNPR
jgi:cell pole-organizing protein PopZ